MIRCKDKGLNKQVVHVRQRGVRLGQIKNEAVAKGDNLQGKDKAERKYKTQIMNFLSKKLRKEFIS